METNLTDYMKNITLINKDISRYTNEEKGIMFHVNTIQLLVRLERFEYSSEEYKIEKFKGSVEELDYDVIEIDRPTPKNTITNKDEDKYTLVNSKVKVRVIFKVSNGYGIYKCFTNKDEALEYANEININILPYFE